MKIHPVAFLVVILIVVTVGIGVVVPFVADRAEEIDLSSANTSELILEDNGTATTLTGISPDNVVTTKKNRTWLEFDGVNDRLIILSIGMERGTVNESVSVWSNTSVALNIHSIYGHQTPHLLLIDERNVFCGTANSSTTQSVNITVASDLNDSQWHFLACSYNIDTFNYTVFIDGIYNSSNYSSKLSGTGNNKLTTGYNIGYDGVSDLIPTELKWEGSIDEWRHYFKGGGSLSLTEMNEIYNSGRIQNCSLPSEDLFMWLPINENTGTDIHNLTCDTSTTFTGGAGISGATWNNDDVDITLTDGTDYSVSGNDFTTINQDLAWTQINATYTYDIDNNTTTSTITHLINLMIAIGIISLIVLFIKQYTEFI